MCENSFIIQRDIVSSLPPRERFLYYELTRLAVEDEIIHEEYNITIPRGCWIISYRKLAQLVDMPLKSVQNAVKNLVEKGMIQIKDVGRIKGKDGNQKRTMFVVSNYEKIQAINTPKNTKDDTPALSKKVNDINTFEDHIQKNDTPNNPSDDTPHRLQKANNTNAFKISNQKIDTPTDSSNSTTHDANLKKNKSQSFEADEYYGEYQYVKGALNWIVSDDRLIFNLYKKHILQTDRNTIDVMELWGEYCSQLEAKGITDFNSHIGKFLQIDGYNMKTKKEKKKEQLAELPIKTQEQILAKTTKAAI